jgi:hypothetical protein
MSSSLFDLYVAELCPDDSRETVRLSNDYADVLTRFLDSCRNRLPSGQGDKSESGGIGPAVFHLRFDSRISRAETSDGCIATE